MIVANLVLHYLPPTITRQAYVEYASRPVNDLHDTWIFVQMVL